MIDDEPMVRRLFELALGDEHEVSPAATASEGFEAAQGADLVFCDLNLPDCPGSVLTTLRDAAPDVPLVAISGNLTADHTDEAARTGAQTLAKPFGLEELRRSVRASLPPAPEDP